MLSHSEISWLQIATPFALIIIVIVAACGLLRLVMSDNSSANWTFELMQSQFLFADGLFLYTHRIDISYISTVMWLPLYDIAYYWTSSIFCNPELITLMRCLIYYILVVIALNWLYNLCWDLFLEELVRGWVSISLREHWSYIIR